MSIELPAGDAIAVRRKCGIYYTGRRPTDNIAALNRIAVMAYRFAYGGTVARRKLAWLGLAGLVAIGCATTPLGAAPADLARGRDQFAQGATVFANECAGCHGPRGEGLASAPAILGAGALPEFPRTSGVGDPTITDPQLIQIAAQSRPAGAAWRDPFRNALDLFTFTTTHLPKSRARELKQADYWSVTSFVLAVQGASLPPGGVDPAGAASIPIPKR
jgi:mono/diheme cytochrome c family protein